MGERPRRAAATAGHTAESTQKGTHGWKNSPGHCFFQPEGGEEPRFWSPW